MSRTASPSARPAAYVAAALATLSAAISLYWTLGGKALLSTVGGAIANLALRGGTPAIALGLATVAIKLAGAFLALLLVHPHLWRLPTRLVRIVAALGSVVLILYGGALVLVGALVLTDVITPGGPVDRHALRWHVLLWDLWFLLWGLALGLAVLRARGAERPRLPARRIRARQ